MVRAGETGGVLEESLLRTADQLEKDASLRRQIRAATIYPTLVITFAMIVLLALVTFLIPVFAGVFKQFGGKLPALTQFMVDFSHILNHQWYLVIVAVVGLSDVVHLLEEVGQGPRPVGRVQAADPDEDRRRRPEGRASPVGRARSASLVAAGVPIMQAIDITGRTAGNAVIEKAMAAVIESVKAGGMISTPLRKAKVFPAMVSHMIGVGEETGALDAMLSKVADFYEDEVEAAVRALTSILEPAMIIIVGGIVGVIVVSMYLPLFDVYNHIQ